MTFVGASEAGAGEVLTFLPMWRKRGCVGWQQITQRDLARLLKKAFPIPGETKHHTSIDQEMVWLDT